MLPGEQGVETSNFKIVCSFPDHPLAVQHHLLKQLFRVVKSC